MVVLVPGHCLFIVVDVTVEGIVGISLLQAQVAGIRLITEHSSNGTIAPFTNGWCRNGQTFSDC